MTQLPLRTQLAGKHPYGAPQLQVKACLNVNENPFSPPDDVIEAIGAAAQQAAKTLNRYPERDFWQLRRALADYLYEESHVQLAPEQIWAANGSNEIMIQLFQAYAGPQRVALTFTPSYSMYPEYAQTTSTQFVTLPRRQDYTIDIDQAIVAMKEKRPALILVASPNNPTGTSIAIEEINRLALAARSTGPAKGTSSIVVIDEAYGEFRRDGVSSALELLSEHRHLVVSRTMSKAFGAAGLRLGYMAGDQQLIKDITIVRLPYHLSAITQATALAALQHRGGLRRQVQQLRLSRDELVSWLKTRGLDVLPTDANFICFGSFADRHAVFEEMLARAVLIREVGPQGYLRVSVGTPEENDLFCWALAGVMTTSAGKRT